MKKTRKQTVLAKCVLATIMAMGMMGYTTVWADTPTPSPVDKTVSKDAAGQIYDAAYGTDGWNRKYFWTDLGHAQYRSAPASRLNCSHLLFIIPITINGIRKAMVTDLYIQVIIPKCSAKSL